MTKHLFISSSYVLHFELLKNVMGALPQALKIIFEMQRKKSNEKITRRNKSFPTYKMCACVFFFLWTPFIFKSHNFLNSFSL
jgi:hypothetical protein